LIATFPVWIAWIFIREECPTGHLTANAREGIPTLDAYAGLYAVVLRFGTNMAPSRP
jgi:hypothetical protein